MTMVELREVIREAVAAELAAAKTGGAPLLSSAEVSKQWNVPRTWIEEAGRAGKLPRVVIGSYIRFKVEDIERFIEENRKAKN
ncbi:MAG TPA: helix-turn-helix domain-containing protein [Candidatus Binatia bacterium]